MLAQYKFDMTTPGRGIYNITEQVAKFVAESTIKMGLCNIFLHHTSASLIICENFDPLVQKDLEAFMSKLVPDNDPLYEHIAEGPDDMPSHVRSVLTQTSITIPVTNSELDLGRWQGLYLWEHRIKSHHRKMTVTING